MSRHHKLKSASTIPSKSPNKREPLLRHGERSSSTVKKSNFGEVVGGTVAECVAICCCCPCGLVNLLYSAIYKIPTRICLKVLKMKRRKRLIKQGLLPPERSKRCKCGCDDTELQIHPATALCELSEMKHCDEDTAKGGGGEEMVRLEKEMWEIFYETGFWRSKSQRETPLSPPQQPQPLQSTSKRYSLYPERNYS